MNPGDFGTSLRRGFAMIGDGLSWGKVTGVTTLRLPEGEHRTSDIGCSALG